MSSPSETAPSVPTASDSPSELKTVCFKLSKEGRAGFYLPTEDKDELFRLFKKRASKLNIPPNARYLAWHGGMQVEISDADLLAEVAREQLRVFVDVCDVDGSETLPHSFAERFYGRAKGNLHARNHRNCCKRSETWDRYNCMVDSCPYQPYYTGCYLRSTRCCDPYNGHPSSLYCQEPFHLMYPHHSVFGSGCCYEYNPNKFKQCRFYSY